MQTNRYKLANYETIWVMKKMHEAGELTPLQEKFFAPERPTEELYDVQDDPFETVNLADSSSHGALLHDMRGVLDDWIRTTNDRGRFPEDPDVIDYYDRRMDRLYRADLEELREKWGVDLP